MRSTYTLITACAFSAAIALGMAAPATAGCTRLGFSVNDYGKEGPARDAQELLDKHIAKKMAERGVQTYKVGKKDVKCELFLNFIVFDEHTCTAEATVCWDDAPAKTTGPTDAAVKSNKKAEKKAEPVAPQEEAKPAEASAPPEAAEPAQTAAPAAEPAPASEAPVAAPSAPSPEAAPAAAKEPEAASSNGSQAASPTEPQAVPPAPPASAPAAKPAEKKADAPVEIYERVTTP